MTISSRTGHYIFAALVLAFGAVTPAYADDVQDINRLLRQGQLSQALERADSILAQKPRDAQIRFLKGLILTEQKKTSEAITVFAKLSEDYPELPEPYNNLAVLYASQGQFDKARAALELAIRTHPSYATAHENLGDIYSKLATQAYDKALQLDSTNTAAQTKLSLIRNITSGATAPTVKPAAKTEKVDPVVIAATPPAALVAPPPFVAKPEAAPVVEIKPAPVAETKTAEPAKPATGNADAEITQMLHAWAKAWAKKDVPGYLSYYARDFQTPRGQSRSAWEKSRKQRIAQPKLISVSLDAIRIQVTGPSTAKATFRQNYRSDALKAGSVKTMILVKSGGKWLIQQERVGK